MDVPLHCWSSAGLLSLVALMAAGLPQPAGARDHDGWRGRHARDGRAEMHDARRGDRVRGRDAVRGPPQAPSVPLQPPPQFVPPPAVIERVPEAPGVDRWGRPLRLTPDERRALRQQINDAGRDVYRP